MPNNPLPDDQLAELDRLRDVAGIDHLGYKPGVLKDYVLGPDGDTFGFSVQRLHWDDGRDTNSENICPAIVATYNAYPALRQRLLAAESRLAKAELDRDELEVELEEARANSIEYEKDCTKALCSLAREFEYEWGGDGATADDLREFISETVRHLKGYRDTEAVRRAKADCYDRICEHLGVESNVLGAIAARDAQQRREGAAEELTELANNRFGDGLFLPESTHYTAAEVREILEEAAQRLREGK